MPTPDADHEAAWQRARATDDAERARRDELMRREVRTLEATVQAMWDLLDGKEEHDAHPPSLPESR